jgi:hypothetical protein
MRRDGNNKEWWVKQKQEYNNISEHRGMFVILNKRKEAGQNARLLFLLHKSAVIYQVNITCPLPD